MAELSQIIAIVIFLAVFIFIIMGKIHRYIPALVGGGLVLAMFLVVMRSPATVLNVLSMAQFGRMDFWLRGSEHVQSHGVNWQTIVFIGGMMAMVEGLAAAGFFRWLCLGVAKALKYRVMAIFIAFMLLSGFLSMFIDSITVMLFLASVTVELGRQLKFDPVPVVIAEIFASNVGGSATMAGDPPNIIIGTAFGYSFSDFVVNTGPLAWAGMALSIGFFYLCFRKTLASPRKASGNGSNEYPDPGQAITNRRLFWANTAIFVFTIVMLIAHAWTGFSVALIGVMAAVLALVASGRGASHIIRRLDWRTLVFFIGLFIIVGGLEETGALKTLADYIERLSGGNLMLVIPLILWISAFASAIVDNIPFAATMVPVLANLSQTSGLSLTTMSWALALGTDIGGNATPIGASANVVGTAICEREGFPIKWGRFLKYAVPATILVVGLIYLLMVIRYA